MHRLFAFVIVVLVTVALITVAPAATTGKLWAQEDAVPGGAAGQSTAPVAAPATQDGQPSQGDQGESWRYRRHQGKWWYWLPTNRWVVWNGQRWVDYDGKRETNSHQPRDGRTGYSSDTKLWGPIRYDRWGQPQYPYSRRTSGLRQLGPVPAMGGVRSLPGWGGER